MSLSQKRILELREVVNRTGGNREVMINERILPSEYLGFLDMVERTELTIDVPMVNVPVRLIVSVAKNKIDNCPVHVNMHGGGFVLPQNADDDMYCAKVATQIKGVVVDVDYASSFDHPFPVAFEQCYEAVKWAFCNIEKWNGSRKNFSIGGHSAGGNLASAISLRNAQTKDFDLCLQVLDYAAIDLFKNISPSANERVQAFSELYSGGDNRLLQSPYCSPVFATDMMLKNQPKTLIVNCGSCDFKKDNENYGIRLVENGNEVIFKCFMNSRHGSTVRCLDEWEAQQDFIISIINQSSLEV